MDISEEDKLENLLQSKTWSELTDDERQFILAKLGNEEVFTSFRKVDLALNRFSKSKINPRADTLRALRNTVREQKQSKSALSAIFNFKIPAYAAVLALIAISLGSWFFLSSNQKNNITYLTRIQRDTVFLKSQPDTVTITKVHYRTRTVRLDPVIVNSVPEHQAESEIPVSVSMKEKEALDNLLVSGTE
jgi:hypothetical protein